VNWSLLVDDDEVDDGGEFGCVRSGFSYWYLMMRDLGY
jgi:hypothetical protein